MKVQADEVNGVYEVKAFDNDNQGLLFSPSLPYSLFKACLKESGMGTLACDLSDEEVKIIDDEYGINRIEGR